MRPPGSGRRESGILVASFSAIIALIALGVSVKSCDQSNRALELSEGEFVSGRLAVWGAQINVNDDDLLLEPINSDIVLQVATVTFPPQLDLGQRAADPPKFSLSLLVLKHNLQDLTRQTIPSQQGYVVVLPEMQVPLVIESIYIAKGNSYSDRSLYVIRYSSFRYRDDDPYIKFKGLQFLWRISETEDTEELLRQKWDSILEMHTELGKQLSETDP